MTQSILAQVGIWLKSLSVCYTSSTASVCSRFPFRVFSHARAASLAADHSAGVVSSRSDTVHTRRCPVRDVTIRSHPSPISNTGFHNKRDLSTLASLRASMTPCSQPQSLPLRRRALYQTGICQRWQDLRALARTDGLLKAKPPVRVLASSLRAHVAISLTCRHLLAKELRTWTWNTRGLLGSAASSQRPHEKN